MQKIVVAVTGASGSIYAKVLLSKLIQLNNQIDELSLLMTPNAKEVWKTELENESYQNLPVIYFNQQEAR